MKNQAGYCQCGCGGKTKMAAYTNRRHGMVKGQPMRFIHNHHARPSTPLSERFWDKVAVGDPADCWPWTRSKSRGGYGQLRERGRQRRSHRIAWELTNGPVPAGLYVCHRCDNPPCCNPAHLFLGTARDNTLDAVSKQRLWLQAPEAIAPSAKLRADDVTAIRLRHAAGDTHAALAREFGVSPSAIRHAVKRISWPNVP